MTFISEAKCIWQCTGETGADRYISFFKDFSYTGSDEVTLTIAADSTYVVRINGTRCPISQLADRPGDYINGIHLGALVIPAGILNAREFR